MISINVLPIETATRNVAAAKTTLMLAEAGLRDAETAAAMLDQRYPLRDGEARVYANTALPVVVLARLLSLDHPTWRITAVGHGCVAFTVPVRDKGPLEQGYHVLDVGDWLNALEGKQP